MEAASVDLKSGIVKLQITADSYSEAWNELQGIVTEVEGLGFEAEPYFSDTEEDIQ